MIRDMEAEKARLKEKVSSEIDRYFAELEKSAAGKDFDINELERLMVENQRKVKAVLNEANSELASNVEAELKKTVHTVARR